MRATSSVSLVQSEKLRCPHWYAHSPCSCCSSRTRAPAARYRSVEELLGRNESYTDYSTVNALCHHATSPDPSRYIRGSGTCSHLRADTSSLMGLPNTSAARASCRHGKLLKSLTVLRAPLCSIARACRPAQVGIGSSSLRLVRGDSLAAKWTVQ
jgi:hypothetical protein